MSRISRVAIALLGLGLLAPLDARAEYDWTGFYVGANSGFAWGNSDVETVVPAGGFGYFVPSSVLSINSIGERKLEPTGFTGGVQAGFDWQMQFLVLGLETDFEYFDQGDQDDTGRIYPCCAGLRYEIQNEVDTDWLYTLRGKIGLALDRLLVFGSGGLALTDLQDVFDFRDNSVRAHGSMSKLKAGWSAGGGVEYGLLENVSVRLEYLHVDFEKESKTEHTLTGFPGRKFKHSVDLDSDIARFALNLRF